MDSQRIATTQIQFDDFLKVDIRVGTIVKVDDYPEARKPAYKLEINFGDLGKKRSSAQITQHYKKEDLIGKQVIAVVNFPPKQSARWRSLVLKQLIQFKTGLKPKIRVLLSKMLLLISRRQYRII